MEFIIENQDYSKEAAGDNGNRFLIGNGYMGIRGTLDEHGKEELAAVNLAGIYDRVGTGWREPLNAPNPLYTVTAVDGKVLTLPETAPVRHHQQLDFRYGIFTRETAWTVGENTVTVRSSRFAHMAEHHLLYSRYQVTAAQAAEVEITAGIARDIWEIYGPHYNRLDSAAEGDTLLCHAFVQNGKDQVAVGRRCTVTGGNVSVLAGAEAFTYRVRLAAGETVTVDSVSAIFTTADDKAPLEDVKQALEAPAGYDDGLKTHKAAWDRIWKAGEAVIEGDDDACLAVNYSLYHLNAIAPRHRDDLSIAARGLSGQTYKGAIFWDSEIFMLDYFLYTQPEVARSMVKYRIETLPGALDKARHYGWDGAFYAWESQEGGYDACTDYNVTDVFTGRPQRTYFRDKQVHISAAVARAIMLYVKVTGDNRLLAEGGARTVLECARFYYSLLLRRATRDIWEIHDVIGPDEYHERVNNNGYTNRMAQATIRWAVEAVGMLRRTDPEACETLCRETGAEELLAKFTDAADKLYIPQPNGDGIIEQFDGYFDLEDCSIADVRSRLLDPREYWGGANGVAAHTQVLKQADVITMLEMFHNGYSRELMQKNWDFYEPRTEHGSSLSACMYALVACRCAQPDRAYPFFMKSAKADWNGGGKQWAGLVYIGGTHPASEGGAWKVLAEGFAGLETENGVPRVTPNLPSGWKRVAFNVCCGGRWYHAELTPEQGTITPAEV